MRLLLLGLWATACYACSCAGNSSVHQAWARAPLVFVGTVDSVDPVPVIREGFGFEESRVTAAEAFKGAKRGQQFLLSQMMNSCSPHLKLGDTWLFYLAPAGNEAWRVPACDRSTPVEHAAEDLSFLRGLPDSAKVNRLSGVVTLNGSYLAGVQVTARGTSEIRTATTNADGVYQMSDLPPGDYNLEASLPARTRLRFVSRAGGPQPAARAQQKYTVRLGPTDGAGISFHLAEDTRITGRVLDPAGKPMPNVCVHAERANGGAPNFQQHDCTNSDGEFVIEELPSGAYLLVANRSGNITADEPFGTVWYPGVAIKAAADTVTVQAGTPMTGVDIRIPVLQPTVIAGGIVQFADGMPAARALVGFVLGEHSDSWVRSDADGRFRLPVLQGPTGTVSAQLSVFEGLDACPHWKPSAGEISVVFRSAPVAFIPVGDSSAPLVLTLPVKSCAAWPGSK